MKSKLLSSLIVALTFCWSRTDAAVTDFTFLSGFNGANERPTPNSSVGTYTINLLRYDSSIGSFGRFDVNVDFNGLTSTANNAHIHGFADANTAAGVIQGMSFTAATSGNVSGVWSPGSASDVNGLFNGMTYLNLHSQNFPGGEWRGQLVPVPEPSTLGLAALGALGGLVWCLRRSSR